MATLSLLFIVFLVLKLTGIITWSWFWVISPLLFNIFIYVCYFVVKVLLDKNK